MSHLGYHIPNFTYPGTPDAEIFVSVVAQAKEAESAGFDRLTLMDHFYQIAGIGAPDEPMLECYTMLAALAQHTENLQLAALVTGNTYRNPALLAKEVTTLDHVSGGRATLGIGAGWYELEHTAYGYEFGTFGDRFEKLEEALQIIIAMLRDERPSLNGAHYRVTDAVNRPTPVSSIPILIGGNGERKTLRMVAQYADESNLVGLHDPAEVAPKLQALDDHCHRLGRSRDEVTVTMMIPCCVAPTTKLAEAELEAMVAAKGFDSSILDMAKAVVVYGDPDTVGERLAAFMATGIDGVTVSAMFNGHIAGRVALLGQVARDAIG